MSTLKLSFEQMKLIVDNIRQEYQEQAEADSMFDAGEWSTMAIEVNCKAHIKKALEDHGWDVEDYFQEEMKRDYEIHQEFE